MRRAKKGAAGAIGRERDRAMHLRPAISAATRARSRRAPGTRQPVQGRAVQFQHHAAGAHPAAHRARLQLGRQQPFGGVDRRQHRRFDADAGLDAAGQAGCGGQLGHVPRPSSAASARTVALSMPASTNGWRTPCRSPPPGRDANRPGRRGWCPTQWPGRCAGPPPHTDWSCRKSSGWPGWPDSPDRRTRRRRTRRAPSRAPAASRGCARSPRAAPRARWRGASPHRRPAARCAAAARVRLSTPPLTAMATGPMPASTASSRARAALTTPSSVASRSASRRSAARSAWLPPARASSDSALAVTPSRALDQLDPQRRLAHRDAATSARQRAALDALDAQADRRGLAEAGGGAASSAASGPDQHLHMRGHPAFFAEGRHLQHVMHARQWRAAGPGRWPDPPASGRRPRSRSPTAVRCSQAAGRSSAASKASTRRQLLSPGRVRVPKPMPVRLSRRTVAPRRPAGSRWRRIAAPVGVTRSPPMPSSNIAKSRNSRAVAGAGTGIGPCAVRHRPEPSGSGPTLQRASPRARSAWRRQRCRRSNPRRRPRGRSPRRRPRHAPAPRPRPGRRRCRRRGATAVSPSPGRAAGRGCRSTPYARAGGRDDARAFCGDREAAAAQHVVAVAQQPAGHARHALRRRRDGLRVFGKRIEQAAANMSPAMPPSGSRCRCLMGGKWTRRGEGANHAAARGDWGAAAKGQGRRQRQPGLRHHRPGDVGVVGAEPVHAPGDQPRHVLRPVHRPRLDRQPAACASAIRAGVSAPKTGAQSAGRPPAASRTARIAAARGTSR